MKENWLCPLDKCPHYDEKCYKGDLVDLCWRGYFDLFIFLITFWFRGEKSNDQTQ